MGLCVGAKNHKMFGNECKLIGLLNKDDKAFGKGICKGLNDSGVIYSGTFLKDVAHGVSKYL